MNHEKIRANLIAAEAWPEGTTADEKALRRLLAGVYGVTYGDDGELQNSAAHPFIDFKRDPVEDIALKIGKRAMAALAAAHGIHEETAGRTGSADPASSPPPTTSNVAGITAVTGRKDGRSNPCTTEDSSVPAGWKLVPVDPTDAMIEALGDTPWVVECSTKLVGNEVVTTRRESRDQRFVIDGWEAMLAAAPSPCTVKDSAK